MQSQHSKIFQPITHNLELGAEAIALTPSQITENENSILESANEIITFINDYHIKKLNTINAALLDAQEDYIRNPKDLSKARFVLKLKQYELDTKQRNTFVTMMMDEAQQDRLLSALESHWRNKRQNGNCNISDEDIELKTVALQNVFKDFAAYGKFAYLTADDLSAVARTVDLLISAIDAALHNTIKNPKLIKIIESKREELNAGRRIIEKCMQQHLNIYQQNLSNSPKPKETHRPLSDSVVDNEVLNGSMLAVDKSTHDLSGSTLDDEDTRQLMGSAHQVKTDELIAENNDILLPIREQINDFFGKKMVKADLDVWVDQSLHLALPVLPFDQSERGTVESFFSSYLKSNKTEKPEASEFTKTPQFLATVVSYLGEIPQSLFSVIFINTKKGVNAIQDQLSTTVNRAVTELNYYYDPVTYWQNHYEQTVQRVTANQQKRKEEKIEKELAKQPHDTLTDNKNVDNSAHPPSDKNSSTNEVSQDFVVVNTNKDDQSIAIWKEVMSNLIDRLKYEMSSSSFLWNSTKKLKQEKIDVLEVLLTICNHDQNLEKLKLVAKNFITNKQVMQGSHSRTAEVLEFITKGKDPNKLALSNSKEFTDWKKIIGSIKSTLEREIEVAKKSCFTLQSTLKTKKDKFTALEQLAAATDMKSLRKAAQNVVNTNCKASSGWTSRTEEVLEFILKRKDPSQLMRYRSVEDIRAPYFHF